MTTDILNWSSNWHAQKRKAQASRTVTYRRGADTITISASIGKTEHQSKDRFNFIEIWQSRDYLILADDLKISGARITPTKGDVIEDTDDAGDPIKYKVVPDGEDVFRYSDKYGQRLRIFTKRMD